MPKSLLLVKALYYKSSMISNQGSFNEIKKNDGND